MRVLGSCFSRGLIAVSVWISARGNSTRGLHNQGCCGSDDPWLVNNPDTDAIEPVTLTKG